jgi:predicted MPP superfamily phosphohydrolase
MNRLTGLSRRRWLRLGAGALLLAGWPGALRAKEPATKPFHFLALNDLHFADAGCTPFFERLVKQLKATQEHPEFCLLQGDLSDTGKPEQLDAVRGLFKTLGIPVYAVIGNHDYRVDGSRQPYEQTFPGALNYTFEHQGWQFVGLDTSEGGKVQVRASQATLDFLDQTLPKLDRSRPPQTMVERWAYFFR